MTWKEKLNFTPIRLNEEERLLLEVLNQTLEVSEYTDVVDVTFSHTRKSKESRILESLVDLFSTMSGLLLAINLTKGEKTVSGKTLDENFDLYTTILEVGRRYKIMNPTKMRNTYGKLMHIMMDLESEFVKHKLGGHAFFKDILTVGLYCEKIQIDDAFLEDRLLEVASRPIISEGKAAHEIAIEAAAKKAALDQLIANYSIPKKVTAVEISRIVESLSDTWSYESFNVLPVQTALEMLKSNFDPKRDDDAEFSLKLSGSGRSNYGSKYLSSIVGYSSRFMGGGACLSHDHNTQFTFVKQSLTLWSTIMQQLPILWYLADLDMTRQPYRLADTGQGYMRLQSCPRVGERMRSILSYVQKKCGEPWVGLSVVHLGDRDVPNALVFIDKYVQVPRILAPVVKCVSTIDDMSHTDANFDAYVRREWVSIDSLKKQILADFFKHGFDGSGDDGGSCIDGRLTSAWNWCSKIYKKPYYYIFMFTGFQGFDGDFK